MGNYWLGRGLLLLSVFGRKWIGEFGRFGWINGDKMWRKRLAGGCGHPYSNSARIFGESPSPAFFLPHTEINKGFFQRI
jgi:hypothetical protein